MIASSSVLSHVILIETKNRAQALKTEEPFSVLRTTIRYSDDVSTDLLGRPAKVGTVVPEWHLQREWFRCAAACLCVQGN